MFTTKGPGAGAGWDINVLSCVLLAQVYVHVQVAEAV